MKIENNKVVSIHYTLTNNEGEVLDSSRDGDPLTYLHGYSQIIPGLEQKLEGMEAGSSIKVEVKSEDGYGDYDEDNIFTVPKTQFPNDFEFELGVEFRADTGGAEGPQSFTIIEIEGDEVTIDGNHPLAGQDLYFDVSVEGIREATAEEIDHGHVHGPEGHEHD